MPLKVHFYAIEMAAFIFDKILTSNGTHAAAGLRQDSTLLRRSMRGVEHL